MHPLSLLIPVLSLSFLAASCVSGPRRPCTDGGQPAWEKSPGWKGNRRCNQRRNTDGAWVNDGKYVEWFPDGKRALEGEYKMGVKTGKWFEWDEKGKLVSERWFEDGKETTTRETKPIQGAAMSAAKEQGASAPAAPAAQPEASPSPAAR